MGPLTRLLLLCGVLDAACPAVFAWEAVRYVATGGLDLGAWLTLGTVPAAIGTLWVWQRADEERERGERTEDVGLRTRAGRVRRLAFLLLLLCAASMLGQVTAIGWVLSEAEAPA